jgi:hypothetical protein
VPPTIAIGAEAQMPHKRRKIRNAVHVGVTAHAIVKMMKRTKVPITSLCRPYCSLRGPKRRGPKTYPIRNTDMGREACVLSVILKSSMTNGIALLGRDEPNVLLRTAKTNAATINAFLRYTLSDLAHSPTVITHWRPIIGVFGVIFRP